MSDICERRKKELKQLFNKYDKNNDGFISTPELRDALFASGLAVSRKNCDAVISRFDLNDDRKLDLMEYIRLANECASESQMLFKGIDTNCDGSICLDELREMLISTGTPCKDKDLKAFFDEVDTNKDGKISYDEFCIMMSKLLS